MTIFVKAGADLNMIEPNGGPKLYWASCAGDIDLAGAASTEGIGYHESHRLPAIDLHFTHDQFIGEIRVLLCGHPLGLGLRLRPVHQMIARPQNDGTWKLFKDIAIDFGHEFKAAKAQISQNGTSREKKGN